MPVPEYVAPEVVGKVGRLRDVIDTGGMPVDLKTKFLEKQIEVLVISTYLISTNNLFNC